MRSNPPGLVDDDAADAWAAVDATIGRLAAARRVVVFSGAGISAESGVPTFRGEEGLWRTFDPMRLATPEAFARDPVGVWAWYRWRRHRVRQCAPNAGHLALVGLAERVQRLQIVTQNVDGLHVRAGSNDVITLHGELFETRCSRCRWRTLQVDPEPEEALVVPDSQSADPPAPRCPHCGSLSRPGVVWFGEALPGTNWEAAAEAAGACDVMLVVGTSAAVYPAAGLVADAKRAGAWVVGINPMLTEHAGDADAWIRTPAAWALAKIAGGLAARP